MLGPRTRKGLLAALILLAGCNAHVASFAVTPRHLCAGQDVHIAWEVQGNARLSIDPRTEGAPDGAVDSKGQAAFKPTAAKTRVSLHATRWLGKSDGADYDVEVVTTAPIEIAGSLAGSSCDNGVLTVATEAKGFSDDLRAGSVSTSKRALDIRHQATDGREVTASVAPGSASDAFANLPIDGRWMLSTKLWAGESCAHPPHVLTAVIFPSCQGAVP
jgi:hypothetical protein